MFLGGKHDPSLPPPGPKEVETPPVRFHDDGRIVQRNMPKLDFHISETTEYVTMEVELSRFLDTSLLDLQVERTWVRLVSKGKPLGKKEVLIFDHQE
jgi:protein TilB